MTQGGASRVYRGCAACRSRYALRVLLGLLEPFARFAVVERDAARLAGHVLDAVGDLLMAAVHHRALHRVAQIAACALRHVALVRVGIAALRALEALGSKSPSKPHSKQWSIGVFVPR